MRTLIVGAGAVGQYLAARLRMGGHDVTLLARPRAVRPLVENGVTLHVGEQTWPTSVRATADTSDPQLAAPFELVIVAVKAYSTAQAIADMKSIRGCAESSVLTIQNGLGNEELLADAFGADRIVAGALTTAAKLTAATDVAASLTGGLVLAPVGKAPHNWILAAFEPTGVSVRAAADWRAVKWSKLALNLLANATCAVLDWPPAQVYADSQAFAVERLCLFETTEAMNALGVAAINLVDFPSRTLFNMVRTVPAFALRPLLAKRVARARGNKLPSLLIDVRAGKQQLEIEALNGGVAVRAAQAGVPAPANATITRLVLGIARREVDWAGYRGNPAALLAAIRQTAATG